MAAEHPQRDANLIRIRHNQRKSRARRKEYLHELETRYRNCEQIGIEAAVEIQVAARCVLDENKRLRQLLKQHGVPDAEINCSSSSSSPSPSPALESMIGSRRVCGESSCARSDVAALPNFISLAPQPEHTLESEPGRSSRKDATHTDLIVESQNQTAATIAILDSGSYIKPSMTDSGQQQNSVAYNASSCHAVASAIRSVRPEMGHELEAELGCEGSADCSVPSTRAFDLLDRFSER